MLKGIILAGGTGTRLFPVTRVVSKQLLPVYDKPMIYYPLCTLMLAGIRDILVITTPKDAPLFSELLADGGQWGLNITFAAQPEPKGIAQAFIIGEPFIGADPSCLILGDNIFFGHGFGETLARVGARSEGATVFGYWVKDPQRYGVIAFDADGRPAELVEKPTKPRSNYAVTGLYFYDNQVIDIARGLTPSRRGELEITDINNVYLAQGRLRAEKLGRGIAWLDTGTHESLIQAAAYMETLEARQGLKVACPEEVAYRKGYISADDVKKLAHPMRSSSYGEYLLRIATEGAPW